MPQLGMSGWDVFSRRGQQFSTMPGGGEHQADASSLSLSSLGPIKSTKVDKFAILPGPHLEYHSPCRAGLHPGGISL